MSRSRKKNPCYWYCSHTSKMDKRFDNRRYRRHCKQLLNKQLLHRCDEDVNFPPLREISNQWSWTSDGKGGWWEGPDKDDLRQIELFIKIMRK